MKILTATLITLFLSTAAQAFDTENDMYGSVLFDDTSGSQSHAVQPGVGDAYGSVLFDDARDIGQSGDPQPGYPDNYGSILLDI